MPLYDFRNKETGEVTEVYLPISELDCYKQNNPTLEILPASPLISYSGRSFKPDDGFRDKLKEIKKAHKHSNIETY